MKIAGMNSHEINDETNSINISPVRIEIYFYHEEQMYVRMTYLYQVI